mmetsp:Transcript_42791/g.84410  ORF Transcript_42791/g.84410 Transcript_42791/m.84410 type:complete len:139 (-) Transcript_42791:212-628(-)
MQQQAEAREGLFQACERVRVCERERVPGPKWRLPTGWVFSLRERERERERERDSFERVSLKEFEDARVSEVTGFGRERVNSISHASPLSACCVPRAAGCCIDNLCVVLPRQFRFVAGMQEQTACMTRTAEFFGGHLCV